MDIQQFFDTTVNKATRLFPCPVPICMEAMPDPADAMSATHFRWDTERGKHIAEKIVISKHLVEVCFEAQENGSEGGAEALLFAVTHEISHSYDRLSIGAKRKHTGESFVTTTTLAHFD